MIKSMRESTLSTLGLGSALDIFERRGLPKTADLVDKVFGEGSDRGSMVISGACGIVGAGKTIQFASRLEPFGIRVVALDFPGAPDGIGKHYQGLVRSFGREKAERVMQNIVRLNYDGKKIPRLLEGFKPRFLLEAIPEVLEIKKAHYQVFREAFKGIEICSVTSGFPSEELGVSIAHPAFPHNINKVWEIVEPRPSPITHLLWSLGLIPVPVGDNWSFVLDVLFCGLTLSALRYHEATNMPYWKIDKYIRKLLGPNPCRAHDAIGAKGADFLTWSCLHHLSKQYGDLFKPTADLEERKETGQEWYPPSHFRPLVNWSLDNAKEEDFAVAILGPMIQMTALLIKEKRTNLSNMNAIGELCAQFRSGILSVIRRIGHANALALVEKYLKIHPRMAKSWHPSSLDLIETAEWQQLYVNAEHNGSVGVITISRESYNWDVNNELSCAIDWLKGEGIESVILTGDFHLSTQMVGADTADFYPALKDVKEGYRISNGWSKTARRLTNEFKTSVGFINGKRCLGGFLELLTHCHYVVSTEDATLGMPEVTLPVVPGMEGCHWLFRKATTKAWPDIFKLLLTGEQIKASSAYPWLIDYVGPRDEAIKVAWEIATGKAGGINRRHLDDKPLKDITNHIGEMPEPSSPALNAGREAILACVKESSSVPASEAIDIQSRHSAAFMSTDSCQNGRVGSEFKKTMLV